MEILVGLYDAGSVMICNLIWGRGGWSVLFGFGLPVYLDYALFFMFHGLHDIFV